MSHIDDLITEYCPDGVEYTTVNDAVSVVPTARGIQRSNYGQGSLIPIVDQGKSPVTGYTDDESLALPEAEYIVFGDHTRAVKWVDFAFAPGADGTKVLRPKGRHNSKFVFYVISALEVQSRGYNRHWTTLRKLRIPVPPLEVQREIVRILDTFTELEAALEVELEARQRQFEHYRFEIIQRLSAPLKSLSDLGQWRGGITPPKANRRYWDSGTIPWLASMDVSASDGRKIRGKVTEAALEETSLKIIPGPTVVVVMRSNILRRALPIGLVKDDVTVNQDIRAFVPRRDINVEYVYQALSAAREDIRATCVRTDGSMAAVDSTEFLDFQIPIPSLVEQKRVADTLRHFDAIVNDFSVGLPAELAARRRQYEYYRDRLLTFEEVVS